MSRNATILASKYLLMAVSATLSGELLMLTKAIAPATPPSTKIPAATQATMTAVYF